MPTYVFKCPKCGHHIEQLLSIKEYTNNPHPMCVEEGCDGQQKMEPQIQASGIIFKGSGWTPRFAGGAGEGPSTDLLIGKKR